MENSENEPADLRRTARYNPLSKLMFCWLSSLLRLGFKRQLEQSDLQINLTETDSEKLHRTFTKYWQQELAKRSKGGTPRLWMVIFKCFWHRLLIQGIITLAVIALMIAQALLLGKLTRYFSLSCDQRNNRETRNAYLYGGGLILCGLTITFLHAHSFFMGEMVGMMTRVMMTSAIYNKVLSLGQSTIGRVSVGHIVNLASNDVHRYDLCFVFVHYIWVAPIHLAITTYLVYHQIGWPSFILMSLTVVVVVLQILSAKLFSKLRAKSAKLTDRRVHVMNEVISGIRVIKMYAWEYAFKKLVKKLRRHEIKLIAIGGVVRTLSASFNVGGGITIFLFGITLLVHVGTGGELSAEQIFTTLTLINGLVLRSIRLGIRGFFLAYDSAVGTSRIENLLLLKEQFPYEDTKQEKRNHSMNDPDQLCTTVEVDLQTVASKSKSTTVEGESPSIKAKGLHASWICGDSQSQPLLHDITFTVDMTASLLSIIGPVGSGKSSLLQCLMGELEVLKGTVDMKGRISYASQDPWIFPGTIQENITLGHPLNKNWYEKVLNACALDQDIQSFGSGDLTVIGERGLTLSGGQKARVNLARAVYRDADIYFLDDPFSAVDAAVGKHIFDECVCGILKEKLVIVVTHQVHFALQANQILALKEGKSQFCGATAEILTEFNDSEHLLGFVGTDRKEQNDKYLCKEETDSSDSENEDESHVREVPEMKPDSISLCSTHAVASTISQELPNVSTKTESLAEDRAQGMVSMKTYSNYFKAGGNYLMLLCATIIFISAEAGNVIGDWWLTTWAQCFSETAEDMYTPLTNGSCLFKNETAKELSALCLLTRGTRLGIYAALVFCTILNHFARGAAFYVVCINASRVLHNKMFNTLLHAQTRFFDTNSSGRILNRFSKDIGFMDDLLPFTFFTFLALILHFVAVLVVASASNPYLLTVIPVVILIFILLRWYYLKSGRAVKRLEAVARSPIYGHLSTTLQGLPTIRSLSQQKKSFEQFHFFNNEHSKGWYFYLTMARWFGIRLDLLSNILLVSVVAFSVPIVAHTNLQLDPSLLSLGLTYTLTLSTMFQLCIKQSAELENQMISTERVLAYGSLKTEASLETEPPSSKPPEDWPTKGEIVLEDVALKYSSSLPWILKNLSFSVKPSEKIGIVGRTGAGKSSIITVLFRMAEPAGSIKIDGIDIKSIGLHDLRKKISIIPQDPVLFSGTVRYNLDPFAEYCDAEVWKVLEQVQLKLAVSQMRGKLDGDVAEGGKNFSVGQRQLVCLARALLRNRKILILDEATANVDPKTDEIIQKTIRENFSNCTVLTIAHRLNTVMDSDRVLVMNKGRVQEFDSPCNLLQDANSQLYKMVETTGKDAAESLHQMVLVKREKWMP